MNYQALQMKQYKFKFITQYVILHFWWYAMIEYPNL